MRFWSYNTQLYYLSVVSLEVTMAGYRVGNRRSAEDPYFTKRVCFYKSLRHFNLPLHESNMNWKTLISTGLIKF